MGEIAVSGERIIYRRVDVICCEIKLKVLESKIRVAAVDYLNTKPLLYGLINGSIKDQIDLSTDYPARIAERLLKNEVDIAFVPVAIIPELPIAHIITEYCIGSDGAVASVSLFSEVPMTEITTVILDYQSRTSVALFHILCAHHWKITPLIIKGEPGFESQIKDKTAGVIIGDRALLLRNNFDYLYDLGLAWKEMTGLPFVFAAWIANKLLPEEFIKDFNNACGSGFDHLPQIVEENHLEVYDLYKYYTNDISYKLDENKRKGLQLFLGYL